MGIPRKIIRATFDYAEPIETPFDLLDLGGGVFAIENRRTGEILKTGSKEKVMGSFHRYLRARVKEAMDTYNGN